MEEPITIQCPYCGEAFVTFADPSVSEQTYIEDCQVCCKPIELMCRVNPRNGRISLQPKRC